MSKTRKSVSREVNSTVREVGKFREIVVTVDPVSGLVGFRPKGLRRTEWLPANWCWSLAVKKRVEQEKRDKKKKK